MVRFSVIFFFLFCKQLCRCFFAFDFKKIYVISTESISLEDVLIFKHMKCVMFAVLTYVNILFHMVDCTLGFP